MIRYLTSLLHAFSRRQLSVLMVAGILLFAQTASLLHAEVHHFHEHEAECDMYLAMENQSVDLPTLAALPLPDFPKDFHLLGKMPSLMFDDLSLFHPRAPPRLS